MLKTDYVDKYYNLTKENLAKMSLTELEEYEDQMTIKNVTCIAEDVRQRIDDEHGPGGCFMNAFLTPMKDKAEYFFSFLLLG